MSAAEYREDGAGEVTYIRLLEPKGGKAVNIQTDGEAVLALEMLEGGLKKIEAHGWTQGHFGNPMCGFCTLGALLAAGQDMQKMPVSVFRRAKLHIRSAIRSSDIAGWNDQVAKEQAQVVRAFNEAIEAAKKEVMS